MSKSNRVLVLIILCSAALFSLGSMVGLAETQTKVHLSDQAWVEGRDILLGEIASFDGPDEFVSRLQAVNVGQAPLPGSSRRVTIGHIEVRLRQVGIKPSDVEFEGNSQVEVRVRQVQPQLQPEPPFQGAELILEQQAEEPREMYQVVTVNRDIARGDILAKSDLQIETREVRGYIRDAGEVGDFLGKRATRYLPSGTSLTATAVEVPPVVERGGRVWIVAQQGTVRVSAPGVARSDGGLGEVIQVENTTSRQVIYAEVIDSETVQVSVRGESSP